MSIWDGERYLGSGFLIAKNVVVTCAHVVKRAPDEVSVRWRRVAYPGTVLVRDPKDYHPDGEPFPDIAFIGLTSSLDHQIVNLAGDDAPPPHGTLAVLGFSRFTPEKGVSEDRVEVEVEGRVGKFLKVKHGVLVHGLSGAAVVDESGWVVGMAKSRAISYNPSSAEAQAGGWLVPASEIRRRFKLHEVRLKARLISKPTLIRPDPGTPLQRMLLAQRELSAKYPYRIAKLSHRPAPPLSMVYVEQRTQMRRQDVAPITPVQMIRRHRHALVVAGPGGGKSTLLQQLVAISAEWWLRDEPPQLGAEPDIGPVVALRVAATDLLQPSAWYESVARAVNTELRGFQVTGIRPDIFEGPPAPGAEWLILIDGLDEVISFERRIELTEMLQARVGEYGATVRFGVASRRLDEAEFVNLRRGLTPWDDPDRLGEYQLRPFDDAMLTTFADKWFRPPSGPPAAVSPESFLQSVSDSHIRPLVEVPLLATIAAVVHEENPGRPLAEDRAGLYEQFVSWLLTRRALRPGAREALIERVSEYGREAIDLSEFLFERRHDCLARVADMRLNADDRQAEELVRAWLEDNNRTLPYGIEPIVLKEFLLSTGLMEIQSGDLQFIHLSIAEYLAAKVRASTFDPQDWLQRAAQTGPDSLGLFTAKEWVRAGNDLLPAVRELMPADGRQDFDSVAALLQDGVVGERTEEVIQLAVRAVRRGDAAEVSEPNQVRRLFRAVLQRGKDRSVLPGLLANNEIELASRLEAAKVLLAEGTPAERKNAADVLADLAYGAAPDAALRMQATVALAEASEGADRTFALQHLVHLVETHSDDDVRAGAIVALAGIGQRSAALMAMLRRCCRPGQSATARLAAVAQLHDMMQYLQQLSGDVDELEPDGTYAPAWGLQVRYGNAGENSNGLLELEPLPSDDLEQQFRDDLVEAIALAERFDPRGTEDIVRVLMNDRAHSWGERVGLAQSLHLQGRTELARRALRQIAADPLEAGERRVAAMTLFHNEASRLEAYRTLEQWVADPRENLDARLAALRTIAGELELDNLDRLVDDTKLAFDVRLAALLVRGRRTRDHLWTRRALAAMSRQYPELSPAWCKVQMARIVSNLEALYRSS